MKKKESTYPKKHPPVRHCQLARAQNHADLSSYGIFF
jgi:hypothetical protein